MVRHFPSLIIVKRELVTSLRRVRTLLLVVALVWCAALVVMFSWPTGNIPANAAAQMAKDMLIRLSFTLCFACILTVPGLAAAAVVSEREQETLDALYLTLVRPSGVLAAKAINTVGLYLLLVLGTLPVFATVLFGVGLDWTELAATFALLISTAACCAMIGIVFSTLFKRTYLAIAGAYVVTVVLMGGPSFLMRFVYILVGFGGYLYRPYQRILVNEDLILYLSPFLTMMSIYTQGVSVTHLAIAIGIQLALCVGCFLLATRLLRRQTQPRVIEGEKTIDDPVLLHARRTQFPYYLIDPLRRKPLIEDGRNPMLVREIRWGLFSRGTAVVRIFYGVFAVCLFGAIFVASDFKGPNFGTVAAWYVVQMSLLVVLTTVLVANVFSKEYELANMDMLRMTQLNAEAIVRGKTFAFLMSLTPIILAMVGSCIPILIWQFPTWRVVAAGLVTLMVCALLSTSAGLLTSLLTRRTNRALVAGLATNAMLFLGLVFAGTLSRDFLDFFYAMNVGRGTPLSKSYMVTLSPIYGYVASFMHNPPQTELWLVSIIISLSMAAVMLGGTTAFLHFRRMRDR